MGTNREKRSRYRGQDLAQHGKADRNDTAQQKGRSGLWLLGAAQRSLGIRIQGEEQSNRRTLGAAKYRLTSFLSIETLWLWVMGLSAESFANTFAVILMEPLAFVSTFLHDTDHTVTILNLTGSALEEWCNHMVLFCVDFSGSCGGKSDTLEQAARSDLTFEHGMRYISFMLALGVLFNILGRQFASLILAPLLESHDMIRRNGKRIVDLSETVWDDLLFYACLSIMLAACLACRHELVAYGLDDLLSGFFWVPISFAFGQVIEGSLLYEGVQWGTWRCNAVACGLLFVGTFLGALSSFNGTSSDTVQLLLNKSGKGAAVWNVGLNLLTMVLATFAIRAVSQFQIPSIHIAQNVVESFLSLSSPRSNEL
ncbi:hypothetical protein GUITHDRAFT_98984 [Guillardia theta CCMP2712]|uniref:Uncharacterized protein n=1 Tax=Guillardia theta (strain CCMP2712) TaxID=905079 RepID=L1K3M6_GUITC|nr:hypothetical protein GUITHDRAFT_98984 [Guillardia theta CCMP2712]EKX55204.1 hypothetical protein GUITHDRAFT_98984 [Guillardia theta CCMP2712]|eukprot:XP_005842184.1 hypothetical protein GUITHDRAFT_98984 [Guillardia theta CCMP2712]